MRSEPVELVTVYLVGGMADDEFRDVPVTSSGMPAPFVNVRVKLFGPSGVLGERVVPYRLEFAQHPGRHSRARYRYVCAWPGEGMPEHDWDSLLGEVE